MIRGTYFVGADYEEAGVANSTSETELVTFVIPANTVVNGIIISVNATATAASGGQNNSEVKVKIGTDGSETLKATFTLRAIDNTSRSIATYHYVVDDLDWTSEQSVSITGTNSTTNASAGVYGQDLVVLGY